MRKFFNLLMVSLASGIIWLCPVYLIAEAYGRESVSAAANDAQVCLGIVLSLLVVLAAMADL
jgi:hypothetical protein